MRPAPSHCPDEKLSDVIKQNIKQSDMRDFYKTLLEKFSLRTILTSLARLTLTSIDFGLEKLMSSRAILEKILQDPHLGIKDYISWTTKLSDFQEEKNLINFFSEAGDKQGL